MTSDNDEDITGDPVFAFKPSLMGGMCRFSLAPDAMEWQIGRRSGRIRYGAVRAIRLSYRPVTMQMHRFTAEIWSDDNPKVQIVSSSWRSVVEQEGLDQAYVAFVTELHRRLAAVGTKAQFTAGLPVATYWVGVTVFSAVIVSIAVMTARTAMQMQWAATAIVGIFLLVFLYQLGSYFKRNRPGRYRPDSIPAGVMPNPKA